MAGLQPAHPRIHHEENAVSHNKTTHDVPPVTETSSARIVADAMRWLHAINIEVCVLAAEFLTLLPKAHKSVTVFLNDHEKRCLGCPHLRWGQWACRPKNRKHPWVPHPISNPLARLPRDGNRAREREIVNRLNELVAIRSEVVKDLSHAARVIAAHPLATPGISLEDAMAAYDRLHGKRVAAAVDVGRERTAECADVSVSAVERCRSGSSEVVQEPPQAAIQVTGEHGEKRVFQRNVPGREAGAGDSPEASGGRRHGHGWMPHRGSNRRSPYPVSRNPNPSPAELLQQTLARERRR